MNDINLTNEFNDMIPRIKKLVGDIVGNTAIINTEIMIISDSLIISMFDSVLYDTKIDFNTVGECYFKWQKNEDDTISPISLGGSRIRTLREYHYNYIIMNYDIDLICSIDNVESSDIFPSNLKSSDGCQFIKVLGDAFPHKTYLLPIFTGFPRLNKGDTMNVRIYRISPETNIIKYIVHKKKLNKDVTITFRSLNFS